MKYSLDQDLLAEPLSLKRQGTSYLRKHGYARYDIDDLANGVPVDNPAGTPNRNDLMDLVDKRPNAEIIATAQMIQLADIALLAWEQGDMNSMFKAGIQLGYQKAVAESFILSPGQAADLALEKNRFLSIPVWYSRLIGKKIKRDQLLYLNRIGNLKLTDQARKERNELICSKGLEYKNRENPVLDRNVTGMVMNHFDSSDLWKQFPPNRPLSEKYVRQILRDGGVISNTRRTNK